MTNLNVFKISLLHYLKQYKYTDKNHIQITILPSF